MNAIPAEDIAIITLSGPVPSRRGLAASAWRRVALSRPSTCCSSSGVEHLGQDPLADLPEAALQIGGQPHGQRVQRLVQLLRQRVELLAAGPCRCGRGTPPAGGRSGCAAARWPPPGLGGSACSGPAPTAGTRCACGRPARPARRLARATSAGSGVGGPYPLAQRQVQPDQLAADGAQHVGLAQQVPACPARSTRACCSSAMRDCADQLGRGRSGQADGQLGEAGGDREPRRGRRSGARAPAAGPGCRRRWCRHPDTRPSCVSAKTTRSTRLLASTRKSSSGCEAGPRRRRRTAARWPAPPRPGPPRRAPGRGRRRRGCRAGSGTAAAAPDGSTSMRRGGRLPPGSWPRRVGQVRAGRPGPAVPAPRRPGSQRPRALGCVA